MAEQIPAIEIDGLPDTIGGDRFGWPPVQEPRVPLLIGGAGEHLTLRRVAQSADMCNLESARAPTPADVRHKF